LNVVQALRQVQLSLRHALPQLEQNKEGLAKKCEERRSGKSPLGFVIYRGFHSRGGNPNSWFISWKINLQKTG